MAGSLPPGTETNVSPDKLTALGRQTPHGRHRDYSVSRQVDCSRQADYFQTGRISRQADNPVRQTTSKQADNIQTGRLLRDGQPILGRQTISRGAVNIQAGKLLPGRQTTLRRGDKSMHADFSRQAGSSRQADYL
jgi:hypothetical protein